MKKDNDKNQKFITTKKKGDNSVEVMVHKSPAKNIGVRILVWIICGLTMLLPLCTLIYMLVSSGK